MEPGSDNQYRLSLILASIIMIIAIIAKIGFDYESIIVDYRTIMQSLGVSGQLRPERTNRKEPRSAAMTRLSPTRAIRLLAPFRLASAMSTKRQGGRHQLDSFVVRRSGGDKRGVFFEVSLC